MAIIQSPICGRLSGSCGGMTFCTVLGANIMKAMSFGVKDAKSEKQLLRREYFKYISNLSVIFNQFSDILGIKKYASIKNKYPFQVFMKSFGNCFINNPLVEYFQINKFHCGKNQISNIIITSASFEINSNIALYWLSNKTSKSDHCDDNVWFLLFNRNTNQLFIVNNGFVRDNKFAIFSLLDYGIVGDYIDIYYMVSDTQNILKSSISGFSSGKI